MNHTELQEYLQNRQSSVPMFISDGDEPRESLNTSLILYSFDLNFDHRKRKILNGAPYLTRNARKALYKYMEEDGAYLDEYLFVLMAKDLYCQREARQIKKVNLKRAKLEKRKYEQELKERKENIILGVCIVLVIIGALLFFIFVGDPFSLLMSVVLCVGTVYTGLTRSG